jgi:tetratricopeptide (TPR) repeat protein
MALLAATVWPALRLRAWSPAAFFGIGWFALTLLPVSNVIPLYSVFAERYLYLPSIGFTIAVVMAAGISSERLRKGAPALATSSALAVLVALPALLYGGRTVLRNRDLRDDLALASATLAVTPESFIGRYWWGVHYKDTGRYDLAKEQLMAAIRVKPDLVPAYGSLGEVYEELGRDDLARDAYQQAVSLQPSVWLGHFKLGLLYQRHGEPEKAFEAFDRAVRLNPTSPNALNAIAAATLQRGDLAAARLLLDRVLALDPKNATAHANLGALYVRLGQPEQALRAFEAAAAADPTLATAHYNLGLLHRRLGRPAQALAAFREAERLDPSLGAKGDKLGGGGSHAAGGIRRD